MTTPTNPNAVYATTPLIGTAFNRRTNTATETNYIEFQLGTTVTDTSGKVWVYVHAPAAIGSNAFVTMSWGTVDAASIQTKTTNTYINGTAAFAADDYGWVQSVRRLGETNYKP